MGLLKALEARLRDGERISDDNADGYYVRTHANVKLGPMMGACTLPNAAVHAAQFLCAANLCRTSIYCAAREQGCE